MSERDVCPYCGAPISVDYIGSAEESIMVTCSRCGGRFEYIVGFGAFTPDSQQPTTASDGFRPSAPATIPSTSTKDYFQEDKESNCCGCAVKCIIVYVILVLVGILIAVLIH